MHYAHWREIPDVCAAHLRNDGCWLNDVIPAKSLPLHALGGGLYRSDKTLPHGRWLVHIEVNAGAERAAFDDEIRV